MSRRCRHEFETKVGYPDDIICHKCQTIWHLPDYGGWTAKQIMHTLPPDVRLALLKRSVDRYNKP